MKHTNTHVDSNKNRAKPCQRIAANFTPEPSLSTAQIAVRLNRSPKTVREWLRSSKDAPRAYKSQNRWQVRLSEYKKWEAQYK